jgi:TRAP-type transport system periplasmic protein
MRYQGIHKGQKTVFSGKININGGCYMKSNKTFLRSFISVLCIVSAFVFVFILSAYQPASAQTEKVIELKVSNQDPPVHYSHVVLEAWAKKVEEQTKGRVQLKIFPSAQLANGPEAYNAVLKGIADVARIAEGFTPPRFPLNIGSTFNIMGAPSGEIATHVRLDLFNKFPEIKDEFKDVHVLFLWSTPAVNIHTRFPAKALKDFKGRQLRFPPAQVPVAKALAAAPVTMAMDESYLALNKGIIDGLCASDEILKSFRLAEVTKYTTNLYLFSSPFTVVMNKKTWDSLPPDVQKVFDDLREWASIEAAKAADAYILEADTYAKGLKHEFINPTPQALEEIYAKIRPIQTEWAKDMDSKGKPGSAINQEIAVSLKKYTAKKAAPAKTSAKAPAKK